MVEALQGLEWQPTAVLGYANHLHDNDRWPMGDAGAGIALPPLFDDTLLSYARAACHCRWRSSVTKPCWA